MIKIRVVKCLTLACGVSLLLAHKCSAIIAYDTPSTTLGNQGPGHFYGNGPYTLGMEFTVNSPVTVTELGAFNSGLGGWSSTIDVAIYNVASQTIVGSVASFFGAGANEGTLAPGSAYRFQSVTPFTLSAGSTYMIVAAGLGTGPNPDYNAAGGPSLINVNTGGGLLTFLNANYYVSGNTLQFPTSPDGGPIARYGAGSFDYFAPVPEAGTFAVAGVCLLGLIYVGRFWVQRRRHMVVA